jgi:hypothetical protein
MSSVFIIGVKIITLFANMRKRKLIGNMLGKKAGKAEFFLL